MSLTRTKIRKVLVQTLKGKTSADKNVVAERTTTNWFQNLPAINIYLKSETITEIVQAPRLLKRELTVDIQVVVTDPDEEQGADKLNALMEEIEDAIEADDSLQDSVEDIMLTGIETEADPGGEKPVLAARMAWTVIYTTGAPRTRKYQRADGDFKTAHADWKNTEAVDQDDPATDTEDTISV